MNIHARTYRLVAFNHCKEQKHLRMECQGIAFMGRALYDTVDKICINTSAYNP